MHCQQAVQARDAVSITPFQDREKYTIQAVEKTTVTAGTCPAWMPEQNNSMCHAHPGQMVWEQWFAGA